MITVNQEPFDERAEAKVMPRLSPPDLPDTGEVYRTADRLREALAVALGAVLYASNELANRRHPRDADAVIAGMKSFGLLPPGVTIGGTAMLLSPLAKLSLRFRPDPLSIEVVAAPQHREDGPSPHCSDSQHSRKCRQRLRVHRRPARRHNTSRALCFSCRLRSRRLNRPTSHSGRDPWVRTAAVASVV